MYPPTDPPDPALLDARLNDAAVKVELSARRGKRNRHYMPALSEIIFCRLVRLPRRAWAVYLVLLLRCRLNRNQTVMLTSRYLSRFGLSRNDKSRGLSDLERAGLILVERRSRRNPTITLLPMSEGS
jgi:hypothetical protein